MLSLLPLRLVLGLVACPRREGAGERTAGRSGQIHRACADRLHGHVVGLADVDDLLELDRGAVQPVNVPSHDRIDRAGLEVSQKMPVLGPLAAAEGRYVGVLIDGRNLPAHALTEAAAVLLLALHAKVQVLRVA